MRACPALGQGILVPREPSQAPVVLVVPHGELEATTRAVYLQGNRLKGVRG